MPIKDPIKRKEYKSLYLKNMSEEQKSRKRESDKKWWGSLKGKYARQKYDAKNRGIEFLLSYEEWINIWETSGKLEERSALGYCMCRFNDEGAYHKNNVYIALSSQNTRDAWDNNKICLPNTKQYKKDLSNGK